MSRDHEFALFIEDDEGLVFREYSAELGEAKLRGQRLADMEGLPALLFTLEGYREVARFSPFTSLTAPGRALY